MALTDLICSYYTVAGVSPTTPGPSRYPFEDRVRACAEAGYVGVGMHVRDYTEMRRQGVADETLRAILSDHGMRHVEVEFLQDWFADGEAGERSRRAEETLCHMAEAFGAHVMFLTGDLKPDADLPFDQLQERFAALCERAAGRGVSIGVEPCAWSNIGDPATGLRLIEGAGAANAGLFLDVWHLYRRGIDYESLRAIPVGRVIGIQLDDADRVVRGDLITDCLDHRVAAGQGDAGTVGFIRVLAEMGVEVPMSVELIAEHQRARPLEEAARFSFQTARTATKAALATLRISS